MSKNAATPAIGFQLVERQPIAVAGELQPPVIPATATCWQTREIWNIPPDGDDRNAMRKVSSCHCSITENQAIRKRLAVVQVNK